jgi:hypothetical protein
VLIGKGRFEEAKASVGTIIPGHVISINSDLEAALGPAYNAGKIERIFAIEDGLSGYIGGIPSLARSIWDPYADNDVVPYYVGLPGDVVQGRLAIGSTVAVGDRVLSFGDGTLVNASALVTANLLGSMVAAGSAIGVSSTAEASFGRTFTIAANTLKVGDIIRIRAHGTVTSSNSTDTFTAKLKIGPSTTAVGSLTAIATTTALDATNSDTFVIDTFIIIRTITASGTLVANTLMVYGVDGTTTVRGSQLASTAIDCTVANKLDLSGTFSASSASNSARLESFTVIKNAIDSEANGYFGAMGIAQQAVNNSAGSSAALVPIRLF